jgi:hypothetical protein
LAQENSGGSETLRENSGNLEPLVTAQKLLLAQKRS